MNDETTKIHKNLFYKLFNLFTIVSESTNLIIFILKNIYYSIFIKLDYRIIWFFIITSVYIYRRVYVYVNVPVHKYLKIESFKKIYLIYLIEPLSSVNFNILEKKKN
jgi:hypothetical protein